MTDRYKELHKEKFAKELEQELDEERKEEQIGEKASTKEVGVEIETAPQTLEEKSETVEEKAPENEQLLTIGNILKEKVNELVVGEKPKPELVAIRSEIARSGREVRQKIYEILQTEEITETDEKKIFELVFEWLLKFKLSSYNTRSLALNKTKAFFEQRP